MKDASAVEPAKVFDNLYYLGNQFVGAWMVNTSEGIILIDSMNNSDDAEKIIVPRIKKLGFDPAKIKYVLVTHGHCDHYGGAKYIQDNFGAKVLITSVDWSFMEKNLKDRQEAEAAKVDSELSAHPFVDNALERMDTLRKRKDGDPNPFVIGEEGYKAYMAKMKEFVTNNITKLSK